MQLIRSQSIFFVLGSFKLGGKESTASRIGMELIKRGYNVKFLLVNGVFDYNDEVLINNSIVLSKPGQSGWIKLIKVYFTLFPLVWGKRPAQLISFSLGINKLIFFLFYPDTIFRIESNIFIFKKKLYRRYLLNFFSVFPHVKRIIIPSKGLYDASFNYFWKNRKLELISNPLDVLNIQQLQSEGIADFPLLANSQYVISAGRLHASKGFEQLISIYKKSKLFPSVKLVILGQGELFKTLVALIQKEKLEEHVILTGYQANPYRFISKARFFVLNSKHESFGNVLIESFACHIPVVSNDCDFGPRHIIQDGFNGFLYHQLNETEFIEKLELVAFNDEIYLKIKAGAIASVNTYNVETIVDQWVEKIIESK